MPICAAEETEASLAWSLLLSCHFVCRGHLPLFLHPKPQKQSFPAAGEGSRKERAVMFQGQRAWVPGAASPQALEGPAAPVGAPWLQQGSHQLWLGWEDKGQHASLARSPKRNPPSPTLGAATITVTGQFRITRM